MRLLLSISLLGLSIAPLVVLTSSAFVRGPTALVDPWSPPVLSDFEDVQVALGVERAKSTDGSTVFPEDPAGFSVEGKLGDDLDLPYTLAECLDVAKRARGTTDLAVAESARKGLTDIAAKHLSTIKKLRPNGDELAAALSRELADAERRCLWLGNRQLVKRELEAAEAAIAAGPEMAGEERSVAIIKALRQKLPATMNAESSETEPGDALTLEEAGVAAALDARASFRKDFFQARDTKAVTSKENEVALAAWHSFLAAYSKSGPPDARDNDLLTEAKRRHRTAQLQLLRATAKEKSDLDGVVTGLVAWLREASKDPDELDQERAASQEVLRVWLDAKMPSLQALPKIPGGVKEGFTATKRLVGFFSKVKQSESQYRWWSWNTDEAHRKERDKGDKQLVLKASPADPRLEKFAKDYADKRRAFLDGFAERDSVIRFQGGCAEMAEDFEAYRQQWDDVGFPPDSIAQGWAGQFADAETLCGELLEASDKHGLWALLETGSRQ